MAKIKIVYKPLSKDEQDRFDKSKQEFYEKCIKPKKKKRPKMLSIFYALLLCLFYVALATGINILSHKLLGLHCGIDSITFSMVFTIVWVLCYIHITED